MAALVLDGIQVKRPRCQEAAQQVTPTPPNWRIIWWRKAYRSARRTILLVKRWWKPFVRANRWKFLPLSELQKFSQVIDEDVYPILSLQSCLDKRAAKGGVSPQQVRRRLLLRRLG